MSHAEAAPDARARPDAVLKETRGPHYPAPGSDPRTIVDFVTRLLADTDPAALERFRRCTRNLLFVDGRQWVTWNLRDKTWRDAPAPEGRIRVSMNYIRPILRARIQRLMSSELTWHAIPRSNTHEDRDKAMITTNLLDHRWEATDVDSKVRYAEWLAFSCGVAYLKQFWNPDIGAMVAATVQLQHPFLVDDFNQPLINEYEIDEQGEPIADENFMPVLGTDDAFKYRPGDTDSAVRSIFNIRMNPDAFGLLPDEGFRWLLDSEVIPISVVKERYGAVAKNVKTVAGIAQIKQFEGLLRSVGARRTASSHGATTSARDGKTIPDKELTLLTEYWESPSDSLPNGRLIVVAGDEMMFDGDLPQGRVTFVPLYDERRSFDAYGRPTVDDLIDPQKVINKQWSLVLEEMQLNGIGQWVMWDVPGLSDQITNRSGAHIKLPMQSAIANRSIGDIVQKVPPGRVSPDRYNLILEAKRVMFDVGAFHEIQQGQVPPGVDSGIAVQLLQEAENGQLQDAVKTLKQSLIEWGRQTLAIANWGYGENEERWLPVDREDLGFLAESVTGSDLPNPDNVTINLEGFRPQSITAFRAEVKEAMDKGYIDPRKGLQMMDLGRGIQGVFESETRHYARARSENLSIERGELVIIEAPENTPLAGQPALLHPEDGSPYMLPSEDEHQVHIEIHQEIALDDTKPWETRQAVLLHINEHRQMLQLQILQAAQAEAAVG